MQDQSEITGYRKLTRDEVDQINSIKAVAGKVGELVENMETSPGNEDQDLVRLGKDHLRLGFMALVRSVAQPESF